MKRGDRVAYKSSRLLIPFVLLAGLLPAADPQLVGLLMPDAKVVAGINVEQARNSAFGQFLLARASRDGREFQNLTALTGFDPRTDLREVLMAARGDASHTGLIVARGVFDAAKIFAAARTDGQVTILYNGVEILNGKGGNGAVAFLDGTIAIAGDADNVRGAIDRRSAPATLDPLLTSKVAALSGSQDAWTVSIVPVAGLHPTTPNENLNSVLQGDLLKSIQQGSAGVKLGAIVQFTGEVVASNDKDATALADVVRFGASMLQMNAPQSAGAAVAALMQSLAVKTDGATVTVGVGIPETMLESLVQMRTMRVVALHTMQR
jgi:hypothetical protein